MPTTWTTSQRVSSIITNYGDGTWGDSTPWGGVIVSGTNWNTRPSVSGISYQYLIDASTNYLVDISGEPLVALSLSSGTPYTTRIIP